MLGQLGLTVLLLDPQERRATLAPLVPIVQSQAHKASKAI
jgi:hypothetical protein